MTDSESYRVIKTYRNLPCAHRRWRHDGACALVHGYSRTITLTFACSQRDKNGFVIDFGQDLRPIKQWISETFDHTLLLDSDDPLLPDFRRLEKNGACKLVVFEQVGMEGTAYYVYQYVSAWLLETQGQRVSLESVECRENDKNAALYRPTV